MQKTFVLSVACNTDDRHWKDPSCYRAVAQLTFESSEIEWSYTEWLRAFHHFKFQYPSIMQLFGVDGRVSITMAK